MNIVNCKHTLNSDGTFGILSVDLPEPNLDDEYHINLLVSIDNSGSMGDICKDGKTKMEHAKHMLTHLVNFLLQSNHVDGTLSIVVFDHNLNRLCINVPIKAKSLLTEILQKIEMIQSIGGTDIGQPLYHANAWYNEVIKETPNRRAVHIFMTDGQATYGMENTKDLLEIPVTSFTTYYVGFGTDHHYPLMRALGNLKNSDYYFVESVERAGMVYGEILHRTVYSLSDSIEIHCHGGTLYDYKSNEWSDSLILSNFAKGTQRTVHLKSETTDSVPSISIAIGDLHSYSQFIAKDSEDIPVALNSNSILKAEWRQKTLEYLFQCSKYNLQSNKRKELEDKGNTLMENLKAFMNSNDMQNDVVLKQLCDDIGIARSGLSCINGQMYIGARQSSCGQQRAYSVVDLDGMTPMNPHTFSGASQLPPTTPRKCSSFGENRKKKSKSVPPPLSENYSPPVLVTPPLPLYTSVSKSHTCYASPSQSLMMEQLSGKFENKNNEEQEQT